MAQGQYKVGETIEVTYQAAGATSDLTDVIMEIYDETGVKDILNFSDVEMTEIISSGRYKGSFTPDEEGKWRTMIDSATKPGKIVKDYDVVAHNIDAVGDAVATVDTNMAKDATVAKEASLAPLAVDATVAKEATVAKDVTVAKTGVDGDTLKSLSDQLDGIAAPDSPPMIG